MTLINHILKTTFFLTARLWNGRQFEKGFFYLLGFNAIYMYVCVAENSEKNRDGSRDPKQQF